jgi:hypothetical protein
MAGIFNVIVQFFDEDDWPYQVTEPETVVQTQFKGENGQWACFAFAKEEQEQLAFYSICPVRVPEDRRVLMAEFLTRANYNLALGNFEMDFSDGEIRYKTSIDVEGDRLTTALTKHVIYANVMMMDLYLPGVLLVIYGNGTPAEAIQRIESPDNLMGS